MKKVIYLIGCAIAIALSVVFMPESSGSIMTAGLSLASLPIIASLDRNGIKIELNKVNAVAIYDQYEKAHVAHVSQDVVSKYPSKKFGSRLSPGLFEAKDAEFTEYTIKRHTLVKIPNELNSSDEKHLSVVQKQLDSLKGTIQRIVSNNIKDVLTEGDEWAISEGLTTLDDLKDRYETRDTAGNRYSRGDIRVSDSGEVINGLLPREYSRRVYQPKFVADMDLREGNVVDSGEQTNDAGVEVMEAAGTLKS